MKPVTFTQHLLPHGRKRTTEINMPDDVADLAYDLIAAGARFDVEILGDGQVSLTCEREDDVLAIEVCPNGPGVAGAVERLIRGSVEADALLAARERKDEQ